MAKKDKSKDKEQKGSSKTVLIIAVAIIIGFVIMAGSVFAIFMMMNKNNESNNEAAQVTGQAKVEEFTVPLEEFLLNLKDENKARYLKVTIALGGDLVNEELKAEVEAGIPQIRDLILKNLRSKTTADLAGEGEDAWKEQIKTSINETLTKGQLTNVYFTDLIIQ